VNEDALYGIPRPVVRAEVDDGQVLLNPSTGVYHSVNRTGAELLECFAEGLTMSEAAERLASQRRQPRDQVFGDAQTFVASMLERGLLEELLP
jgi:hypothetical protein